jgi:MFS family permease
MKMMFASRALAGILSSATLPTAMAYISDSTSQEERGAAWVSLVRRWALAWC